VLSDEAGESSSWVTPTATVPSTSTVAIALAPASYSPPQTQQATVIGASSSTIALAALTPTYWIAQGATMGVPLTVEALNQSGVPQANVTVNFAIAKGTALLSSGSGTTNGSGFATITATITNQSVNVQVTACVAPSNNPCQIFTVFFTPASSWTLETVSGSSQFALTGQSFQPLVMRVTDGSSADNPVTGVNVSFATTLARTTSALGGDGMPILLGSSQAQIASDQNGLASILPSTGNVGPCDVFIVVSAGAASVQFQMESLAAIVPEQPVAGPTTVPASRPDPHFVSNFGPQTSATQSATGILFVFPESSPNDDPPPDSQVSTSPELSAESVSADLSASVSPVSALSKISVSSPSASLKPVDAEVPKQVERIENGISPANVPSPVKTQPDPASSKRLPEDKRSCRELAGDCPMP
jgi:hypothetical protein